MQEKKKDRRVHHTEKDLIHALLTLIETKPYDQISVQDIIQSAELGRSTFYAHYQNKDDLLIYGFGRQLDMLIQRIVINDKNQIVFDTTFMFSHATTHYEIYRALLWGKGLELLIKDGHASLSNKIEERLNGLLPAADTTSIPLSVVAYSMAGSLLILLKWWLDHKMPLTAERMNEIYQQLVMPGINHLIGTAGNR